MKDDPKTIAAGLTEAQRVAWLRTVLAINGTTRQREAFIDGYNGFECPVFASAEMRRQHAFGLEVRRILETDHDR